MNTQAEATDVALSRVAAYPGLWPREGLHQGRVEGVHAPLPRRRTRRAPPLDVASEGDQLLLGDGWHHY